MDDYISREAAIDAVDVRNLHRGIIDALQSIISDIPSADVVEVVRCKDCIHNNSNDPICPIPWVKRMINSFCSFGERKADNGN